MKLAIIGTGNMGFPLAWNLLEAGYELNVYNRTMLKALPLGDKGAYVADTIQEAVKECDVIISVLSNDNALYNISSEDMFKSMKNNAIHVSMSTVSPLTSAKIAELHKIHGLRYLSAPIFGRPESISGKLANVCFSGNESAKAEAEKILLDSCAAKIWDFGEKPESALTIKLAGNFLIASSIEMMAESFRLVELSGADEKGFYELMSQTLFSSTIFKNYGKTIVNKDYNKAAGFELSLGLKDLSLVRLSAQMINLPMPMADLVENRLHSGVRKGRSKLDWTALGMGVIDDSE